MTEEDREKTEALVVQIDRQITGVHDQGARTSGLTDALDDLWEHLREHGVTKPISNDRLEELCNA